MDHVIVDKEMHCYKFIRQWRIGCFVVRRYLCSKLRPEGDQLNLNWAAVGMFRVLGVSKIEQYLSTRDIRGKGLISPDNVMIVWTVDLQEM